MAARAQGIAREEALKGESRKRREAELLLAAVPERAVAVALDGGGRMLSSEEFARRIGAWRDGGAPSPCGAVRHR